MALSLEEAFGDGSTLGASIEYLDSLNSVAELKELTRLLEESGLQPNVILRRIFAEWEGFIIRWPDPQLDEEFKRKFPLVTARLDTLAKIRVLLRSADARSVTPAVMAEVFEDILRQREWGCEYLDYPQYEGIEDRRWKAQWFNDYCRALRIVYHSQIWAISITRLMLPDLRGTIQDRNGLRLEFQKRQTEGNRT